MLRARHRCAPQAVLVCTRARAVSHFTGKTVKGEILLLAHLCQCLSSDSAIHNRLRRMGVVRGSIPKLGVAPQKRLSHFLMV